jgi:OOP family OmpA-OmpF porin
MHCLVRLSAMACLLAIGLCAPSIANAQDNPTREDIIKGLGEKTRCPPPEVCRGIRIAPSISMSVEFATGSAELAPAAVQTLDVLGSALSSEQLAGYRFRIEGHTDTVGSRDANQALSARRATRVVEYLATKFRIDRKRLEPVGKGQDGLLVATPDQTPEPRNRRVQVVNIGL